MSARFVGMQIGPVSFADEGVAAVLDTLQGRFGVNVLMPGTLSWLGLKIGRRTTHAIEGFPDHGRDDSPQARGGSYVADRPEYFSRTLMRHFRTDEPGFGYRDILAELLPAAKTRGMKVIPEFMEPLFRVGETGAGRSVRIPNLPQCLEVDLTGRFGPDPCTSNPDYRAFWHGVIEQHCREYEIDGIMWCNERPSPLDRMIQGRPPGCFCATCRQEAASRGVDVERARVALGHVWRWFTAARNDGKLPDGSMVEFLRVLLQNPEVLVWEKFWLERSKDLDRELYGIVKWCDPRMSFGLNVWNRNHFNPIRKAQWPWAEQVAYADWVKPITYQHQAGKIYTDEMAVWHRSLLRDFSPQEATPVLYRLLGLEEAPWDALAASGMAPETYVGGQCRDAVRGVEGRIPVYMGIGVDAPRTRADVAVCTPEIVGRSVKAAYANGAAGVVFSPNYTTMNLTTLDGGAQALSELGLR